MNSPQEKAQYIMVGGFLGAGKTTSIIEMAKHFTAQGMKVGLITNDQGHGLVDTHNMQSHGFAVEEIPGGCFCCRFNSLLDAAKNLTEAGKPDIFIAEPVGSCTDLVASVTYPLRRIYQADFEVKALSVVLDPRRAEQILGLVKGRTFSPKVKYIYLKQMEEADLLVINKSDLLKTDRLEALTAALRDHFPNTEVISCSARQGDGLAAWFDKLASLPPKSGMTMKVDYDTYAEGEALLGWLNATIDLNAVKPLDGNQLLVQLSNVLQRQLQQNRFEIGHCKMTLAPEPNPTGELAVCSVVNQEFEGELSHTLDEPVQKGQIILNLRAEALPKHLEALVRQSLESFESIHLEHLESFQPGRPTPIHRFERLTI